MMFENLETRPERVETQNRESIWERPGREELPQIEKSAEIGEMKRPEEPVYSRPEKEELPSVEKTEKNSMQINTLMPKEGGKWTDEPGNSRWEPDRNEIPSDRNGTNPEHKTWGEILDEYGIDSIPFKDGYPDFSEISKGEVEIDDFTDKRASNFAQADEKMAEQRGCTPKEVRDWRVANKYTWHECEDCKTMQKVPREVHGNVSHSGGVSMYKSQHADT